MLWKVLGTCNNIAYSYTNRKWHLKNKSTVKVNMQKQKLKKYFRFLNRFF